MNKILLRRKLGIYIPRPASERDYPKYTTEGMLGSVIANIATLGFVFDAEAIKLLRVSKRDTILGLNQWLVSELREMVGVRVYRPMYPNFPNQVMETSEEELFLNAILHYFGDAVGLRILPNYATEARPELNFDLSKLKVIRLLSKEDADHLLTDILTQKTSPSDSDKADIVSLLNDGQLLLSDEIPNKEMLAYFVCLIHNNQELFKKYRRLLKTSTDVLRLAVAMSRGDISLAEDTPFSKFCRQDRKTLLYLLNRLQPKAAIEDMQRHLQKWRRLGEILHPGEYNEMFPEAYRCFDAIRNSKVRSFASKVEENISIKEWHKVVSLLKTRPGDFARSLNRLLSQCDVEVALHTKGVPNSDLILAEFRKVAHEVASNVLWTVYAHFRGHHLLVGKERIFFPKGSTTKPMVGENLLAKLPKDVREEVCDIALTALKDRYNQLEPLGSVYIDPVCKGLVVPTGTRSTSAQLRTVGRGSRFDLDEDASIVRFFMWWRDQKDRRVDLDLSAVIFDSNWNMIGRVNWTQLRSSWSGTSSGPYEGVHSGDITSAPNGACEFLDINIGNLRPNAAYVAMAVFSYTGQTFDTLNDSFAGFMSRTANGQEGEIYEAPTVTTKFDLTTKSTSVCPLLLDVANRQIVWADLAIKKNARCSYVEDSWQNIALAGKSIVNYALTRPTLYDVFRAHRNVRGCKAKRDEADFIIADDGNMSPYDVAKLMSAWL